MPPDSTHVKPDPSVNLSLQSLIDARYGVPYPSQKDVHGLSPLSGQIKGRNRGQGLEFEDLRNYVIGDDMRHIDWKVSARHNQLYTRLYREEKEQRVTLVLDFTASMFTGSGELRAVQAGRLAANLAWHEVSAGGRCGLMIQTNDELIALRPALGDKAALGICAEISRQFDIAKSTAEQTDASDSINVIERLRATGRESGALIILSGLDNTDSSFAKNLSELVVEKQIAVVCIEDPIEYRSLPEGLFRYKSGSMQSSVVLNHKQTKQLALLLDEQREQLKHLFSSAQVPLLLSRKGIDKTRVALHQMGFLA